MKNSLLRLLPPRWRPQRLAELQFGASAYPAHWMANSVPLAYRVLPKCGCSTIGQIFHFLDYGTFYPKLIHDVSAPILRWGVSVENQREIARRMSLGGVTLFTFVRNPFSLLASSYFDKIASRTESGGIYRGGEIHRLLGIEYSDAYADDFWIDNFLTFLRFVESALKGNRPEGRDIHWTPCSSHIAWSMSRNPSWKLDYAGHLEKLEPSIPELLAKAGVKGHTLPKNLPRENQSLRKRFNSQLIWSDEAVAIVRRLYEFDFKLFGYADDPRDILPAGKLDADAINRQLRAMIAAKARVLNLN